MTFSATRLHLTAGLAALTLALAAGAQAQVPGANDTPNPRAPQAPTQAPTSTPAPAPTATPAPGPSTITVDLADSGISSGTSVTLDRTALASLPASDGSLEAALSTAANGAPDLIETTSSRSASGLTHSRYHQVMDGRRVWGSDVKAARDGDELVHVAARVRSVKAVQLPLQTTESAAIAAAVAEHHGPAANASGYWHEAPSVEPVMIVGSGAVPVAEPGFAVTTWSAEDNMLHRTLVDSQGIVVESELRTSQDRYRVYLDHPAAGGQVIRSGPGTGSGSGPSPAGWLSSGTQYTRLIQGNNVAAYMDTDDDNQPDGGTVVEVGNTDFLAVRDGSSSPTTAANQDAAVQNLFWLNNVIHDTLYNHGFTEAALNFQVDNFGRGGSGGDSVLAEAQDGSGTNNANFATPADGSSPRMQMYIWTATNPNRDSAFDSDIVWHEYGHGLTWRMIGSMSGSVSGAIGEGMGDVLAILQNNDDVVGEYSTNRASGIRSAPYTNYPRTIGDFGGDSVHRDGEIYAAAVWRAYELYQAAGLTRDDLMDTLVDGMNFTSAAPTYLNMRNGLLGAAPGAEDCLIWQAFADYGMGDGATFSVSNGRVSIGESFRLPSGCVSTPPPPPPPPAPEPEPEASATVSAMVGARGNQDRTYWAAQAQIQLSGAGRGGVRVSGRWSNNTTGTCTTDSNGRCNVTRYNISRRNISAVSYRIDTLNGSAATGSPLSVRINRP